MADFFVKMHESNQENHQINKGYLIIIDNQKQLA